MYFHIPLCSYMYNITDFHISGIHNINILNTLMVKTVLVIQGIMR